MAMKIQIHGKGLKSGFETALNSAADEQGAAQLGTRIARTILNKSARAMLGIDADTVYVVRDTSDSDNAPEVDSDVPESTESRAS